MRARRVQGEATPKAHRDIPCMAWLEISTFVTHDGDVGKKAKELTEKHSQTINKGAKYYAMTHERDGKMYTFRANSKIIDEWLDFLEFAGEL